MNITDMDRQIIKLEEQIYLDKISNERLGRYMEIYTNHMEALGYVKKNMKSCSTSLRPQNT